MTIPEIGRALERVEEAMTLHTSKLEMILVQTTRTNGRVDRHEDQLKAVEQTVNWAWRVIVSLNVTIFGGVVIWWLTR